MDAFNLSYNEVIPKLKEQSNGHITLSELKKEIANSHPIAVTGDASFYDVILYFVLPLGGSRMSINIYDEFYDWINNASAPQIGKNVSVNNFAIMQGDIEGGILDYYFDEENDHTDLIVPTDDEREICKNVNSSNKYYLGFNNKLHAGPNLINLPEDNDVKKAIRQFLINEKILETSRIYQFVLSNNTNCD